MPVKNGPTNQAIDFIIKHIEENKDEPDWGLSGPNKVYLPKNIEVQIGYVNGRLQDLKIEVGLINEYKVGPYLKKVTAENITEFVGLGKCKKNEQGFINDQNKNNNPDALKRAVDSANSNLSQFDIDENKKVMMDSIYNMKQTSIYNLDKEIWHTHCMPVLLGIIKSFGTEFIKEYIKNIDMDQLEHTAKVCNRELEFAQYCIENCKNNNEIYNEESTTETTMENACNGN